MMCVPPAIFTILAMVFGVVRVVIDLPKCMNLWFQVGGGCIVD